MRIDVLTLFPESIQGFLDESIIKRAIKDEKVEINLINFRDYSKLNNNQVDDAAGTATDAGSSDNQEDENVFEGVIANV